MLGGSGGGRRTNNEATPIDCDFRLRTASVLLTLWAGILMTAAAAEEPREVAPGIATQRIIQGEPYELAGKRVVFLNWYYVHPGNFDWRFPNGSGAMVAGAAGPWTPASAASTGPGASALVAQPAQRVGPIVKLERPWESKGIRFQTVMQDQGIYRAWGSCDAAKKGDPPAPRPCYFESKDGMQLAAAGPQSGGVRGYGKNNLLADGIDAGASVFLDPAAPPAERYKSVTEGTINRRAFEAYRKLRPGPDAWEPRALMGMAGGNDSVSAIRGSVSPDGIHWTWLPQPLSVEFSDTQVVAYYDPLLRKYVMYTRWWSLGPHTGRLPPDLRSCWTGPGRRSIGRSETADFRKFPVSEMIYEPTPDMPPGDVLYTNCRTTIPGASDQHLMFPAVWHQDDDTTTIIMLSSHDGRVWHRVPGPAVLDTSPFGQWDGGCIFAHPNLVELPDGSFALPYSGYRFPHKYSRGQWQFLPGYAVWPKGRIVALEAAERGEFTMIAMPGRIAIKRIVRRPVIAIGRHLEGSGRSRP